VRPEDDPDVQLMLAVKSDDVSAFEVLFRKHAPRLVSYASSFVYSRARAEEITQEVFVQVYQNRYRYEPRARFSSWLYRIATNLCLSELRRVEHGLVSRPRSRGEGQEGGEGWVDLFPDPSSRSGEDEALIRENVERTKQILRELPGQQRAALLLARVEGFSYVEVSRSLECSVSAVKSLIHRATVTLRERLVGKETG